MLLDHHLILITTMLGKDSADDDALARQLISDALYLLFAQTHLHTILAQAVDDLHVLRMTEIRLHALGNHLTDSLHFLQLLHRGVHQSIHRLEMTSQQSCRGLADKADAQGKHHPFERHLGGMLDAVDNILSRQTAVLVTTCNLSNVEVVEVGHVVDESAAPVFVNRLWTKRHDVHGLSRDEMLDTPLNLRRTTRIVRTVMGSLAFIAHQLSAAFRTMGDELNWLCDDGTPVEIHPHDLRDDLPTLLHIDIVADVQVETADEILVVQCGAFHGCSCQLHRVHIGHWRNRSCTPHLISHLIQSGTSPFRLELIGNGPPRTLSCESQGTLLSL